MCYLFTAEKRAVFQRLMVARSWVISSAIRNPFEPRHSWSAQFLRKNDEKQPDFVKHYLLKLFYLKHLNFCHIWANFHKYLSQNMDNYRT